MTKHLTHFIKHNFYPEPRHAGAGRYPLQATQPPQKRAVQKNPSTGGLGQYASPEKWEYAMQYQNPAAQLMDQTMRFSLSHGMWCRCILHSVRCLHQLPDYHSKSYRSTGH